MSAGGVRDAVAAALGVVVKDVDGASVCVVDGCVCAVINGVVVVASGDVVLVNTGSTVVVWDSVTQELIAEGGLKGVTDMIMAVARDPEENPVTSSSTPAGSDATTTQRHRRHPQRSVAQALQALSVP